jgi:hypothetical protein
MYFFKVQYNKASHSAVKKWFNKGGVNSVVFYSLSMHLRYGLIRGIVFDGCGLIQGVVLFYAYILLKQVALWNVSFSKLYFATLGNIILTLNQASCPCFCPLYSNIPVTLYLVNCWICWKTTMTFYPLKFTYIFVYLLLYIQLSQLVSMVTINLINLCYTNNFMPIFY